MAIEYGWNPLTMMVNGVSSPKDKLTWSKEDFEASNRNSKAINAIHTVMCSTEFRRISICKIAKDVWDILATMHEGTPSVKNNRLQELASRFETARMKYDETFDHFYAEINDIVNSNFNLGETIPTNRIVRKILRSLPDKFLPKITVIEESNDLDTLKLEDLVGKLQVYENKLHSHQKPKNIAMKSAKEVAYVSSDDEDNVDMAMFAKKFKKFLKMNKKMAVAVVGRGMRKNLESLEMR